MNLVAVLWDANPEMIKIGSVPVRYYGVLFALGIILGYKIVSYVFDKERIPQFYLDKLLLYIIVGTVVGARLGHCLFYEFDYYMQNPLEIIIPFAKVNGTYQYVGFMGLASHGGAIGVLLAIYLYCRKYKIGVLWILDKIALGVPIAGAFIRFGNFMNSEIYGKPTDGSWGVIFANDDMIPRHPTQLYEAFGYIITGVFLWFLYHSHKVKNNGVVFAYFLILMFSTRFILEFFKEDQVAFEQNMMFNMGQWLSVPFILIGVLMLVFQNKMTNISQFNSSSLVESSTK
ncbi:prolipoprotein diacylglyceryl transferase [Myroides marinus]|uniref:Phosphatidylglycerol--prolipoprotein diacylglyceryl transferase n=1 Tax=Myroides marinus TaxID=703342 RepID=A0A1H6YAV8_9FLAO|nr:prolipoprotein diacylglyceryl transferase [Myroides marinus]KUF38581.1 prolipoprotein diacylglyceryl transferase [Myroides marinus]MDM1347044.1 prolipoprotein diacylglyceryl transferase [Myroides marinus]MDM1352221.1 prolipoprotein diacylglyceryl transferase [Myroides marinus]MDM1355625.1 prolipoprotein diacylglyceryl transferase [Myroides marinus]MDM1359427.1 prolipoprotein diacylglyceryl transferase [Myroides marinus]